jgi:HEAT repeat protein
VSFRGLIRQILSLGPASKAKLRAAEQLLAEPDLSPDEVRRRLPELLACGNWEVRNVAVKLIARLRDPALFHVLLEKLLDADEAGIVRRNAAELLAKWGERTEQVEAALCAALDDPYWEVRSEAALALAALAQPGGIAEHKLVQRLYGAQHNGFAPADADPPPRQARERSFEVRACLAEALGAIGQTDKAFAALQALAADPQWLVRFQAAVALAEFSARLPEYHDRALQTIIRVDHLCSGALPMFVFPRRIGRLINDLREGQGRTDPTRLRRQYIHLKQGWHRADELGL